MKVFDLSGLWKCRFDKNSAEYTDFMLPGSACENGIGEPCREYTEMTRESVRCLRPKYEYVGELWLEKEIELPQDFKGGHVTLFLERVNISSELWIDGIKHGRRIIGLSTPHIYDISGIAPGKHILALRLDNSDLLNIDGMSSGYSKDTQSLWLGVIGRMEIRHEAVFHIDNVQIFPHEASVTVKTAVCSDCAFPGDRREVKIFITAVTPDGDQIAVIEENAVLFNKKQTLYFNCPINGSVRYWSEFDPALYTMTVIMRYENECDTKQIKFGMRTIEVQDKKFMLNGTSLALRGTLDCGIYPITGYPPMDVESWLRVCRIVKEYGLNHIRFHSWCPPDAAFTAADMTGIYICAEMPLWLNKDVCALEAGDDSMHRVYFTQEALAISRCYGNHPSFIMFSNGNEIMGDFEMLEDITAQIKAVDSRRLYTLTSNFNHTVSPYEDYICAAEIAGHRVRLQVFHDVIWESTELTYDAAVRDSQIPAVAFEVGQYGVYPDVNSIKDYTGALMPVNFEMIKKDMIKKNIFHKLDRYIKASGRFALLMYKEDIEASMRTHDIGGFELLGLCDYTGQGTATVGMLDVFWKSKGFIEPSEFRRFCSPFVPLIKMNRFYYSDEPFSAELDIYDYSEQRSESAEYHLQILDGDKVMYETHTREKVVSASLDFVKKPSKLRVTLSVGSCENSWDIYVYTRETAKSSVAVTDDLSVLEKLISRGENAIMLINENNLAHPIKGLFKPLFWSPAFFTSSRMSGAWVDNRHPIFSGFPTDEHIGFQWKLPIDNSTAADISFLPEQADVLIEPVPNFFDNIPRSQLFEARIGKSAVLFCGFDLTREEKASAALRNSIYKYVSSDRFSPKNRFTTEHLRLLFRSGDKASADNCETLN